MSTVIDDLDVSKYVPVDEFREWAKDQPVHLIRAWISKRLSLGCFKPIAGKEGIVGAVPRKNHPSVYQLEEEELVEAYSTMVELLESGGGGAKEEKGEEDPKKKKKAAPKKAAPKKEEPKEEAEPEEAPKKEEVEPKKEEAPKKATPTKSAPKPPLTTEALDLHASLAVLEQRIDDLAIDDLSATLSSLLERVEKLEKGSAAKGSGDSAAEKELEQVKKTHELLREKLLEIVELLG